MNETHEQLSDLIIAHFCNAVDNLSDMPISEAWASEWAKIGAAMLEELWKQQQKPLDN